MTAMDSRLTKTFSDYLCTECKSPLYVEACGDPNNAVCPNDRCIMHLPGFGFFDVSKADKLKEEIASRAADLDHRIEHVNGQLFINFLYKKRFAVTTESLRTCKIAFRKWLAIDDFLIYLSAHHSNGNMSRHSVFKSIFSDYERLFQVRCFLEDNENGRYLIGTDKKSYVLKYWPALLGFLSTHGIVVGRSAAVKEAFKFDEIDRQAKELFTLMIGGDFGKYSQQMFDYIINLGYMFESQYLTSLQHRYNPSGIDIAALIAIAFSSSKTIQKWDFEKLKSHFELNAQGKENFDGFYEKYVSGNSLAPVIVFDGKSYLFDTFTPILYSLYLIKCNQRLSPGQTNSGARDIEAKREEASRIFEERIRLQLRTTGFSVPDKCIIVREQEEEHEFDAIGVNESTNQIVIGEAKYRDFAPSSISGKTLVKQELLDEDKLLDWVSDTQSKLEFFKKYESRFKHELSFNKELKDYQVSTVVVTKYKPLISKYRSVNVLDFFEFCERFSAL